MGLFIRQNTEAKGNLSLFSQTVQKGCHPDIQFTFSKVYLHSQQWMEKLFCDGRAVIIKNAVKLPFFRSIRREMARAIFYQFICTLFGRHISE